MAGSVRTQEVCPCGGRFKRTLIDARSRRKVEEKIELVCPSCATKDAEIRRLRERGIVCYFCGKAWEYKGEHPPEELLREAVDHEMICEKNPYIARIRQLEEAVRWALTVDGDSLGVGGGMALFAADLRRRAGMEGKG